MEDPPFRESEQFVLHTAGGLIGPLPIQGRILLTSQRLFYMPARARWLPHQLNFGSRLEIELRDIVSTGKRPWARGLYGGFPGVPLFSVRLRDGTEHTFQAKLAARA